MSDDIEFTLAVQACASSDYFKLLINLLSTLYTGWVREDNVDKIKEMGILQDKDEFKKTVLAKKGITESPDDYIYSEECFGMAVELLGGRPITLDDLQYKTEILVVCDLYVNKQVYSELPTSVRERSRKSKDPEPGVRTLLPDGSFGRIGDQRRSMQMKWDRYTVYYALETFKNEIERLGLSEKIPSIRIISPNNNYGIQVMRTISIQTCRGRMLAMIDDDDISCGLNSLHRIGKTMIERNKYVAGTYCWWDQEKIIAIGNSIWGRVFDAQALKRFGLGFCPTFSLGEDGIFLEMMYMLFSDKFITLTTEGKEIAHTVNAEYPKDIDLKYLYLSPSDSWANSAVLLNEKTVWEEISLYLIQICKQLGIYDTLSKAIPSYNKCVPYTSKDCPTYSFIHTAEGLEKSSIESTNDVICPVYQFKMEGKKIVRDGDPNVKYIWALPSPEKEETVSFTTNIPSFDEIKENVINYELEDYITYNDEGTLVVTGKLRPRSSTINDTTGIVSYNGVEKSWVEWNEDIYRELRDDLGNKKGLIYARTKLRGGNNRTYILLILLALALLLLIIIPIICRCVSNKNNRIQMSNEDEYLR